MMLKLEKSLTRPFQCGFLRWRYTDVIRGLLVLLIPISYLPSKAVWCLIGLLAIQTVELFCLLSNITIDHSRLFEIYGNTLTMHEHGKFFE